MLKLGWLRRNRREIAGQLSRIIAASLLKCTASSGGENRLVRVDDGRKHSCCTHLCGVLSYAIYLGEPGNRAGLDRRA
jgi:hypothetical protein